MKRLLVFFTTIGIIFAKLPVRVELQAAVPAFLRIPFTKNNERHVLPRKNVLGDGPKIRLHLAVVPATNCRIRAVDCNRNTIVRDPLRERITECLVHFEYPMIAVDPGFADAELLGDLPSAYLKSEMFCYDVFVI